MQHPDKLKPSTETQIRFLQTLLDIEDLIEKARGDLARYRFEGWTITEAYLGMTDGERWLSEKVEELTDRISDQYNAWEERERTSSLAARRART
jgi:hypothetical protein